MKLFDDFEAIKFPEENLIFITCSGWLYYIYDPEYNSWKKYKDAGNLQLTVHKYPDVSEKELMKALGGIFPQKETDFMRCCHPSKLWPRNMFDLLNEDYSNYMSDDEISDFVLNFLCKSNIPYKSYLKLKELFSNALSLNHNNEQVFTQIKELSLAMTGKDIYKEEIGIVDGHESSFYFCIQPVRVIDFSDTNGINNVAEMESLEISIAEDDVKQYLTPFLYKYFDDELEANKKRIDYYFDDNDISYVSGFESYATYNFYTYNSIKKMLNDIRDTMNVLSSGKENEFTDKLKEKEVLLHVY